MMSTYTKILYHIVFCTKGHKPTLEMQYREKILKYIWGIFKNKDCHLYQINIMEDHLHILCTLHPSLKLADLIKSIKVSSNSWLKEESLCSHFDGWQVDYGAFTVSWEHKDIVINYIKNQQEHHKRFDFITEYKKLLQDFEIEYDEKYFP
ncbi:MAG: IS200/IS605 family transposase [Candidatus Stygibacter australis]|nr:IS200/IS605 family transposase [Candidatus Stygibacter australis]MDP8322911.1 IS200/IS605 family transposase [Candidatus Stygibacter australis]